MYARASFYKTVTMSSCDLSISPIEYRSVIKFFVIKKLTREAIVKELNDVYGILCPSRTTIYKWINKFLNGRVSVEDNKKGRGRPEEIGQNKADQCEDLIRHFR